jgi:hypothetical protein
MTISAEAKDYLEIYKEGDPDLNERTRNDAELAHHVALASKTAYEAGLEYEASGNREAALNNYVDAYRVGQFIARLYDTDPNSDFLASWK